MIFTTYLGVGPEISTLRTSPRMEVPLVWGIFANINSFFGLFFTHSFTNVSIVVRCHCRTTLPDSCLRLMVFQSRRSLFNSSNCKTSKSMMCEAPIQMSSNEHKFYTYFSKIKCRDVVTGFM